MATPVANSAPSTTSRPLGRVASSAPRRVRAAVTLTATPVSPTSALLPNGANASSLGVSPDEVLDGETPPPSSSAPTTESVGELALMRAVLVDAITCLSGQGIKPSHRARVAMQARAWIMRRGYESVFSFDSICDALDLDGERLRHILLAPKCSKSPSPQVDIAVTFGLAMNVA